MAHDPTVGPFQCNWYKGGDQEQTEALLLWDDANL
jgi:hypothetical protein